MFVLASGLEGSGTTTAARVLLEMPATLGIPTNWHVNQLSSSAQQRHQCLRGDLVKRFNSLTRELWHDKSKQYILERRDTRNADHRLQLLRSAADILRKQVESCTSNGARPEAIVYHRSMPFADLDRTPFLHDLPILASHLGWTSKVLLSLRGIPAAWNSHGVSSAPGRNTPFIVRVEQLLQDSEETRPTFVRYHDLVNNHQLYTACLSKVFATWKSVSTSQMRQSQMLQSPQLVHRLQSPENHSKAIRLAEYNRSWEKMSHDYPFILAATAPGAHCP